MTLDNSLSNSEPSTIEPTIQKVAFPVSERYEVLQALVGGMGLVFFCYDRFDDRPVVLKTFRCEINNQHHVRKRFLSEACEWIFLGAHPNIVQALRVEALGYPAQVYLVLEGIEPPGGLALGEDVSLENLICCQSKYALSFQRSLVIALSVARAMEYATGRIAGLVHRDIKPANVLIDRFGIARLSDFGLARSFTEEDKRAQSYLVKHLSQTQIEYKPAGTPAYIAPELWQPGSVADARTDMYALGLTLYEMITGKRRIPGTTQPQAREAHLSGKLRAIPAVVSEPVRTFIEQCCAYDPNDRYASWAIVKQKLEHLYKEVTGAKPHVDHSLFESAVEEQQSHIVSYLAISSSYCGLAYPAPALQYAKLAYEEALNIDDLPLQIDSLQKTAQALELAGDRLQAIQMLETSLSMAQNQQNINRIIDILTLMGSLQARSGHFGSAEDALQKAKALSVKNGFVELEPVILGNLANVYAQTGKLTKARDCFETQLDMFQLLGDQINQTKCLCNLGNVCLEQKKFELSLDYFKRCDVFARQLNDVFSLAQSLKGIAAACEALQNTEQSKQALQDLVTLTQTWQEPGQQMWALAELDRLRNIA